VLSSAAPSLHVDRPYPGLRPFESHEAFLFHGREQHTQALLDRLASEHFLAVVGTSGSGKSSLVRAGLLPALYRGYLVGASTQWRIAVMRPGAAPLAELTRALAEAQALGPQTYVTADNAARTSLDLTMAVKRAKLGPTTNFLLVVDQFEELFRFERERRHRDSGAEAALFVQSLLEAADTFDGRIYVVLTIRSDFLGKCAQFAGLPEALNRTQYLIPHLTREQRQQAIELPPLLAGVRVRPALVQRLLNDLGDDPAMLPVLQHALMRTFAQRHAADVEIDFSHYTAAGEITGALNDHAECIVSGLPGGPRAYVERLFRCLTTVENGEPVRRPARLDRIYDVLGVASDAGGRRDVDHVIQTFASDEHSLLVSSTGPVLTAESVIDVSHESLIRRWTSLTGWLQAEIRSVEWYRAVAGDCVRYRAGDASPWRDPELGRALALKDGDRWNHAWAEQYVAKKPGNPSFDDVTQFLELSVTQQREEEARKEAARRKEIQDAVALATAVGRSKKLYRLLTFALAVLLILGGMTAAMYLSRLASDREQAERELALQSQLTAVGTERDEQRDSLRQTQEALNLAVKDSAQAKELEQKRAELEKQLNDSAQQQKRLQEQLKNASQSPQKSSYSEALIAISDLQQELAEVREERDKLQSQIDVYATVRVRDASYWKSRAETAEAENKRLTSALAATATPMSPLTLVLPEYSIVPLTDRRFENRVVFAVGELHHDRAATAAVFVVVRATPTNAFRVDQKRTTELISQLQPHLRGADGKSRCPASATVDGQPVWCFMASRARTLAETQTLGRIRFGSATFVVVATGWAEDAQATVDALSLVIYPVPSAPAAAK
jgi:flagellar basal body-associated protein FliL